MNDPSLTAVVVRKHPDAEGCVIVEIRDGKMPEVDPEAGYDLFALEDALVAASQQWGEEVDIYVHPEAYPVEDWQSYLVPFQLSSDYEYEDLPF